MSDNDDFPKMLYIDDEDAGGQPVLHNKNGTHYCTVNSDEELQEKLGQGWREDLNADGEKGDEDPGVESHIDVESTTFNRASGNADVATAQRQSKLRQELEKAEREAQEQAREDGAADPTETPNPLASSEEVREFGTASLPTAGREAATFGDFKDQPHIEPKADPEPTKAELQAKAKSLGLSTKGKNVQDLKADIAAEEKRLEGKA